MLENMKDIKIETKIHARLPVCIEKNINVGDYVKIRM